MPETFVAKYHDEETGADVSISEFYLTIERRVAGMRWGCVIPTALIEDVASIATRHATRLKGEQ